MMSHLGRRARVHLSGVLALAVLFGVLGCKTSHSPSKAAKEEKPAAHKSDVPTLADAMDELQHAIEKPSSPFHVSFKKVESDGHSYQCEAEVSTEGITGQQTSKSPAARIGNDVFPARTDVKTLRGTPPGSRDWGYVRTEIVMAYMNGHIGDAQAGLKYAGDEATGGYEARRYDFDLTNVQSDAKTVMMMTGGRKLKEFNVKGSAWMAKDDGRMVKFVYDYIMIFADGENSTTHYEGVATKK